MKKFLTATLMLFAIAAPALAQDAAREQATPIPRITVTPDYNNRGAASYTTQQTNPYAFCDASRGGECTYTPLEPLPGLPTRYNSTEGNFPQLVQSAFKLLLAVAVAVAVVMLIIGALTYMFSDVIGTKTRALERVRGAMWGVVLLVSSYLILNTINPDLVTFKLDLGPLTTRVGGEGAQTTARTGSSVSYPSVSQASFDAKFGTPINSIQLTGDMYGTAENKESLQQFSNQCGNLGGAVKASGGDGINSSVYSCYVPQYTI